MTSASLRGWASTRAAQLDQVEAAHRAVGGSARGRRWATEQVNHAYVVLLSSQFQGFCRDLHSECVDCFARTLAPARLGAVVRIEFLFARRLDRGNPVPSNIGADFNRLGIDFWRQVSRIDSRNVERRRRLEHLGDWRNAIAHQDFDRSRLVPARIRLPTIQSWRRNCAALAGAFDRTMRHYLRSITEIDPW